MQAQQNLTIAKKLSNSPTILQAINNNEKTLSSLSTVVNIKTCYSIGQAILTDINNIHTIIQDIKKTLHEEETYITKRAVHLDTSCYKKLRYILDTSKEQVGLLELQINKNTKHYASDLSEKVTNPLICIQTPYENIIPSMIK